MPEVELILTGFTSHTDQGRLGFCTVGLIRGDKTIIVDTAHHGRRMMLVQALADRGMSPNDIDMVVLTHAHWDHVQNVDIFKNAQVAVGADELEYAKDPHPTDWATSGYFLDMLNRRDVLAVADGQELAPGVRILGTPGHSRGHVSVVAETPAGSVALTGDALTAADCVEDRQALPGLLGRGVGGTERSAAPRQRHHLLPRPRPPLPPPRRRHDRVLGRRQGLPHLPVLGARQRRGRRDHLRRAGAVHARRPIAAPHDADGAGRRVGGRPPPRPARRAARRRPSSLWSIAGAALWSAVALHARRRGLVAVGCACALLLPATGAWWGDRASQQAVDEALSPLFVEEQVTLRGVVLTDPERNATRTASNSASCSVRPAAIGSRLPGAFRSPRSPAPAWRSNAPRPTSATATA